MTDEISWKATGGKLDDRVSAPVDLPEGWALIFGGADWVRQPAELGSRKLYILNRTLDWGNCPQCQAGGPHQCAELQEGWVVLGCQSCKQYMWVKPRAGGKHETQR